MDYALQMLNEQRESESKARAAEIVARVKQLHVDELSVGTKVEFTKRYSDDKAYTFLAVKTDAGWFTTGRHVVALTNEEFEELLAEKLGFENFQQLVPVPQAMHGSHWGIPSQSSHAVGSADPGEEI